MNSDGNLDHKLIFKYDDKGNKIDEERLNSEGNPGIFMDFQI